MKKRRKPNVVQRTIAGMLGLDWLLQLSAGDGAFKGSLSNRLLADWPTQGFTADDELRANLRALRVRARDLSRNNPYAHQFLTLLAANVVGPSGFDHDANVTMLQMPPPPPDNPFAPGKPGKPEEPEEPGAVKPAAPPFKPARIAFPPTKDAAKPAEPAPAEPPAEGEPAPDEEGAAGEPGATAPVEPVEVPNEKVNKVIEEAFAKWSRVVTVDRRFSLTQAEWLAIKTVATDGECFIRLITGYPNDCKFALQFVDADLIDETYNVNPGEGSGPEVRLGVEVDKWGGPVAYHVLDRPYAQGIAPPSKRTRIQAYNPLTGEGEMLHLFIPKRIAQTRGPTWFAPVMVSFKMLSGYEEAELVAARTAAAKMGFIKTQDGALGELSSTEGDEANPMMEANPGSIERLTPGTEFQSWDPTHPSTQYADFVKGVLRGASTGLSVSYNAMCNDLEGVNYSSMRSGLLIERDVWMMLHTWWVEQFLTPVYRRFLTNSLLSGALKLPGNDPEEYEDARWTARGWAWVDPLKDGQAAVLAIENGLASRTSILAEQGVSYEDVLKELKNEKEKAKLSDVDIAKPPPTLPPGFGAPPELDEDGNPVPPDENGKPKGKMPPFAGKKPPPAQ